MQMVDQLLWIFSKHVSSSSDWAAHLTVKIGRACFGLVQSLRQWTSVLEEQ